MGGFDLFGFEACIFQPALQRRLKHGKQIVAFTMPVPQEIGLVTAKNEYGCAHAVLHRMRLTNTYASFVMQVLLPELSCVGTSRFR